MATFELGLGGVSRESGELLHAQVADAIRLRISTGEWPAGHRLPPEPELAEEIGVSRGTLRKGLAALLAEGLLTRSPGRGTFVAAAATRLEVSHRLSTLAEDIVSQGAALSTTVLSAGYVSASDELAASLRLDPGARVFRLARVRLTDGEPFALLHNYVVPELVPDIDHIDFTRATLFGVLEGHYGLVIDSARRRFSATLAGDDVVPALGIERGTAVQYLEQLTVLADGRPIEYSDVWIDSRRLRVVMHLNRHDRRTT